MVLDVIYSGYEVGGSGKRKKTFLLVFGLRLVEEGTGRMAYRKGLLHIPVFEFSLAVMVLV